MIALKRKPFYWSFSTQDYANNLMIETTYKNNDQLLSYPVKVIPNAYLKISDVFNFLKNNRNAMRIH